jgi:hypothetical protein
MITLQFYTLQTSGGPVANCGGLAILLLGLPHRLQNTLTRKFSLEKQEIHGVIAFLHKLSVLVRKWP